MLKHLHKNFKKPDGHENIFIFIHGFGSSSCTKEFDATHPPIISALQEFSKGCGILTFDFIGHGKSVQKNNEANFNITPLNEISNLHEIFSFVTTQHPKSEIIPICASHGALVLSLFLDKYPIFTSSIKKIIAWYPCLQYENIFYTKQKESIIPLIPGSQELSLKMQKEFLHNKNFNPWGNFYITLEFYNANSRPIKIYPEMRICQLVFAKMIKPAENPYKGKYQGQRGTTASRIFLDKN